MDTHDREVLRRRSGSGELALDVAYVTSLLRKGVLTPERVELAGRLGHPVAGAIYPSKKRKLTEKQFQALLKNQTELGGDKSLRLFAVAFARHVLPLFEERYPNDHRPRNAIEVAERFALGQASEAELRKGKHGAWDAAEVAEEAAGVAWAATAAAATAGVAAAWAAVSAVDAAPNKKQERLFQRRLLGDFLLGLV